MIYKIYECNVKDCRNEAIKRFTEFVSQDGMEIGVTFALCTKHKAKRDIAIDNFRKANPELALESNSHSMDLKME